MRADTLGAGLSRVFPLDSLGRIEWPRPRSPQQVPAQRHARAHRSAVGQAPVENHSVTCDRSSRTLPCAQKPGCRVASAEGGLAMPMHSLAARRASDLDRLGDEIAELSAHLELADQGQEAGGGGVARTRTIPPALRRALHHRDGGCRFPGCGGRFVEGHHLRHWAHGGPTTLSNLALLCRRHHRAVHEEGYQVARGPDGTLRFRRPDGRPLPEAPAPAAVPADPVEALRTRHESYGLRLDARTACAGWLGERLNVRWAIDVLHPRAQSARPCLLSEQALPAPRPSTS